jgi:hypothetical protein
VACHLLTSSPLPHLRRKAVLLSVRANYVTT